MLGHQKDDIDLNCTEQSIPEFPNLLFGTEIDSGRTFFDATFYIHKENPQKRINDFFIQYKSPIQSLCASYDVPYNSFFKISKNGHYLVDSNLVYIFIAFVEPNFLGYICDRIHELFEKGVVVSDTYLLQAATERLSKEVLEAANYGN